MKQYGVYSKKANGSKLLKIKRVCTRMSTYSLTKR